VLTRGTFRDIRWMTVTPDGIVYLIDGVDLMRLSPSGELKTVVRGLSTSSSRHAVMGLWTRGNDVYAAEFAGGRVKRIEPRGCVTIVAESRFPWSVTGGAFDDAGHLWVLEWTITNQARVRRVK